MNSAAETFVREFEFAPFNHGATLIAGLQSGDVLLRSAPKKPMSSVSHYLDIYETRQKRLDERPKAEHTEHTESLQFDVTVLCQGLRFQETGAVELWSFAESPHFLYTVFVGHQSRMVLGCVKGVDDRLVTPETRTELWGKLPEGSG